MATCMNKMYDGSSCSFHVAAAVAAAIVCPLLAVAFAAEARGNSSNNSNEGDQSSEARTTTTATTSNQTPLNVSVDKQSTLVPFFYVPSIKPNSGVMTEPPFNDLLRSLNKYHEDTSAFLASMTRMHEVARRSEWAIYGDKGDTPDNPLLAEKLRKKIGWIAECLEKDYATLQELMQPFDITLGLPFEGFHGDNSEQDVLHSNSNTCTDASERRYMPILGRRRADNDENTSYDSAAQVITHIVRDWSACGSKIRLSLYGWCTDMLQKYALRRDNLPVLVPGSGLGRLAYEISGAGYPVEANDVSISMAAVAYRFLNGRVRKGTLHPFCFDFLVNEVDSGKRYDSITYPDIEVSIGSNRGFSYTIGDFVHTYGTQQHHRQHSAIVTCFFIDTATNIYEYLAVIRSVLCSGGVWINVGPVQWHGNALIQPSCDEMKLLIEGFGFEMLTWSLDSKPVNYRHNEDGNSRYTKAEAYLPIRFVARKETHGSRNKRQGIGAAVTELRQVTSTIHRSTAYAENKVKAEPPSEGNGSTDSDNHGGDYVFVDSDGEADQMS